MNPSVHLVEPDRRQIDVSSFIPFISGVTFELQQDDHFLILDGIVHSPSSLILSSWIPMKRPKGIPDNLLASSYPSRHQMTVSAVMPDRSSRRMLTAFDGATIEHPFRSKLDGQGDVASRRVQ